MNAMASGWFGVVHDRGQGMVTEGSVVVPRTTDETCTRVAVSVYASREDVDTEARAVKSIGPASTGLSVSVDVVVHGAGGRAMALAEQMVSQPEPGLHSLSIWSLALGDKAHARNEYVHQLGAPAEIFVFMDGYVRAKSFYGQ